MLVAVIITGSLSIIFLVIGYLIWRKEKISLLHDYHYHKVSQENKTAFCALSGAGVMTIGLGLLLTAIILGITDSAWSFLAFAVGFAAGLWLLIHAGRKYNH